MGLGYQGTIDKPLPLGRSGVGEANLGKNYKTILDASLDNVGDMLTPSQSITLYKMRHVRQVILPSKIIKRISIEWQIYGIEKYMRRQICAEERFCHDPDFYEKCNNLSWTSYRLID